MDYEISTKYHNNKGFYSQKSKKNSETRIKCNSVTYVCDDEALDVTEEDVEVVGDSAPPTKITAAPPPLDLSLDIAPK